MVVGISDEKSFHLMYKFILKKSNFSTKFINLKNKKQKT